MGVSQRRQRTRRARPASGAGTYQSRLAASSSNSRASCSYDRAMRSRTVAVLGEVRRISFACRDSSRFLFSPAHRHRRPASRDVTLIASPDVKARLKPFALQPFDSDELRSRLSQVAMHKHCSAVRPSVRNKVADNAGKTATFQIQVMRLHLTPK